MDYSNIYALEACVKCNERQKSVRNMDNSQLFKTNIDSKCGHTFCNTCINKELSISKGFACSKCGSVVTLSKLVERSTDETEVNRDFRIRRKILSIYNKTEKDFNTLLEYNNYVEMIEDMIFDLVSGINEDSIQKEIATYSKTNSIEIIERFNQRLQEEEAVATRMKEVQRIKDEKIKENLKNELNLRNEKKLLSRQMNDYLLGDTDSMLASNILQSSSVSRFMANAIGSNTNNIVDVAINQQQAIPVSIVPSHVSRFLSQRMEPKPVYIKDNTRKEKLSNNQVLSMHAAGGYSSSDISKRNWIEVLGCIAELHINTPITWKQ